jgi:hypothetical protein
MATQALTNTHLRQAASREPARPVSPEQFLRRDQCLHLERDGIIYATDGRVAILNRVVVDQSAGEVAELVITVEATGQTIVIPIDLVEKTGGSAIFLTLNRSEFSERAASAPAFEKRRFAKARTRSLRKKGKQAAEQQRERAVAQVNRDYIETPVISRLESAAPNIPQKR